MTQADFQPGDTVDVRIPASWVRGTPSHWREAIVEIAHPDQIAVIFDGWLHLSYSRRQVRRPNSGSDTK